MKKVLLIMAAALLMMTQCRKPETPSANTIKMTITVGPGAKTYIYDNGAIEWSENDTLYVSDGTNWLGSLTLVGEGGNATGTFEGTVQGIDEGTTTCHFFYLGRDNGMTGATVGENTNAVISFASQNGTPSGAFKYHLGHGSADVEVSEGVATAPPVTMMTKIAIAHLKLKMDGTDYKGSVTMDVSNTMTVNPNGTFTGDGKGITIAAGTTGDRYVTLIPTTGTESVEVSFSGSATGSMTFGHGIQANNLYGMENGIEVTLEASVPKFSVAAGTTVEFAPGNLYWDGTDSKWKFEENQWSFASTWDASHVSHLKWSDETNAVSGDYITSGDLFCANNFTVAGDSHTWRTLSINEWGYLLGYKPGQYIQPNDYGRPGAKDLRAWMELDGGTHKGLVILPDGTENPSEVLGSITSTDALATYGAVFLPAAGYREQTGVSGVGSDGRYWSSTPNGNQSANGVRFQSSYVSTRTDGRVFGWSVRLVR